MPHSSGCSMHEPRRSCDCGYNERRDAQISSVWTPTCYIRYKKTAHPHGGSDTFLEQKWKRAGEEVWRKVEVV